MCASSAAVLKIAALRVQAMSKLLRSISGIGGISDRSLSRVLKWVKDNPEVLAENLDFRAASKFITYRASGVDRFSFSLSLLQN